MATLYYVGAGANFNGANWALTSGGVATNTPTAADNCILDSNSGNITINSGSVCRSLDCTSGTGSYTGTVTHTAAVTITIGDGTAGAGNVALKLASGMTYTLGNAATSAYSFASTSGTTQTITTAGKTLGNMTWDGAGGSWQLADTLTATGGSLTLTRGTLDTNGQTVTAATFASSNSNTRTLTLGSSAITLSGSGTSFLTVNNTGLTVSSNTATITMSGTNGSFQTASGQNMQGASFVLSGSGGNVVSGCTLANLTITGTAIKTNSYTIGGDVTCTGTFTANGNSVTNRILVASNTIGTARTITAATVSCSNLDLMDITGAGAGSWDLSAITGNSGDAGGNSGITFTTPATQTATGTASFTWSTHGWTSRVPLPQDDVVVNNAFVAGRTVTMDMPRAGKSLDFSGSTGAPTINVSIAMGIFGGFTLASNNVMSGTSTLTFSGRSSYTITTAGVSMTPGITINGPSGTYTLGGAFTTTGSLSLTMGTFNTGGFNVTSTIFTRNAGTSTLTMTNSTWNLSSTSATTVWNIASATGFTLNSSGSNIVILNASANTRTFAGAGQTYGTLTYTVASSSGQLTITGANTFTGISFQPSGTARTIIFPASATTTVSTAAGWQVYGTSGQLATVNSSSAGSAFTLAIASGTVSSDYISLKDSTASGNTPFYAGANSTNVSGNTNWTFTAPPTSANFFLMF